MGYQKLVYALVVLYVTFQTGEMAVTITSPANNDATIWLPEDTAVDTAIYTLAATSNSGGTVAYTSLTVDGTAGSASTIELAATGVITVKAATSIDYETVSGKEVVLKADVNDGGTAVTATVTVKLIDVPTFMPSQVFCVTDGAGEGVLVTTVAVLGTTTGTRTYAYAGSGNDANATDFTLASGGALTVSTGKTLSAANDGSYTLAIVCTQVVGGTTETGAGSVLIGVGCGSSSGSSTLIAGSVLTLIALLIAALE